MEGNQLIHEESMSIDTQSDVLVAAVDSLNAIAKDLAAFTNRTARSPGHSKVYSISNILLQMLSFRFLIVIF